MAHGEDWCGLGLELFMGEKITVVTKKDLRIDFYRGSGKGGQKRNKTSNCCRITHLPSGAVGIGESGRSQSSNRALAFRKMAETEKFQKWFKLEIAKRFGILDAVEKRVNWEMAHNIRVEARNSAGKWIEVDLCEELND